MFMPLWYPSATFVVRGIDKSEQLIKSNRGSQKDRKLYAIGGEFAIRCPKSNEALAGSRNTDPKYTC
jgi:hypothetical protein